MRFILVLLITCCFHNVFCQKKQNKFSAAYQSVYHALCENYDTTYIKKTRFDYVLVLGNTNYLDTYTIKNENKESLEFQSDLNSNVGISIGYKIFFIGYSYNINNLFNPNSVKSSELSFTFPTNLLNLEMSYFNNKGKTYIIGYSEPGASPEKYAFEGLNTKILNVEVFCFLNHKRYANGAAYSSSFDYKQQKSAGSVITGLSYTKQNLYFDLSQLPANVKFSSSNSTADFNEKDDTFFAQVGYGYNFVFYKHWLTNLSLIMKTGVKINEPDFILGTRGKMAVAYNRPSYYFGLNCDYNTNFNVVTNSIGNFNIYTGYRF